MSEQAHKRPYVARVAATAADFEAAFAVRWRGFVEGQGVPAELERSTYVWIASALVLATCRLWRRLPGEVYAAEGLWRWAGYVVQLAGLTHV